jgi:hypothetical protein
MKKEVYKMIKIKRFRNAIEAVKNNTYYVGSDDNGDPIFDESRELPVIKYHGTIKLHGTNCSIVFKYDEENEKYGFYTQKKEDIITPQHDNFGLAKLLVSLELAKVLFLNLLMINGLVHNLCLRPKVMNTQKVIKIKRRKLRLKYHQKN